MSFTGFDDAVQAYTNQVSSYQDQVNDFKNQLIDYRDQAKELSVEGFTEIGIPLLIEGLRTPFAQAGILKAQQAVEQFFTPKVQTKVGGPEAEPEAEIPAGSEKVFADQPPAYSQTDSLAQTETIPTQEDVLAAAAQRAPEEVTSEMLPEGAGEILTSAEDVAQQAVSQVSTMATGALDQATSIASDAGEQLSSMTSDALGQATDIAQGLATSAGEALSSAAETGISAATSIASDLATTVASTVDTAVAAATEAATEAATTAATAIGGEAIAGLAGGPIGLVIGGALALGTLLYESFSHHSTAPPVFNPDAESVPVFQSGLATNQ
jgi:hypothetical protein